MTKSKPNIINKSELVAEIGARMGTTGAHAELYVNTLIRLIYEHLRTGSTVNISGFGQFSVSHRMPRIGVNPRNPNIKITIPELNTPKFKAGEGFKKAVR